MTQAVPFQSEVETAILLPCSATRATGGSDPKSAVPLYTLHRADPPSFVADLPRPGWSWSRLKSSR